MSVEIPIRRLPHALEAPLPHYATAEAAGMDLHAAIEQPITMQPGARTMVPTGIALGLPVGYEAQIRPRSGLALKHGLTVLNSPGTVDSDYRGEVNVLLVNLGQDPFTIEPGMRIAQMVIATHARAVWKINESLSETERGQAGFGSAGTNR